MEQQNAPTQESESGTPIHLTLQQFETMDLAFHLSTPRLLNTGDYGSVIAAPSGCKADRQAAWQARRQLDATLVTCGGGRVVELLVHWRPYATVRLANRSVKILRRQSGRRSLLPY